MKRFLITTCVVLASFGLTAGQAFADSCSNVSRAAPTSTDGGPIIKGNWIWLPSIGVPVGAWGFAPPGAADSTAFGFPGANGNYSNGAMSSSSISICASRSFSLRPSSSCSIAENSSF